MDDVRDELSATRRDIRRIEDDIADIARKKAATEDVELVARKQSAIESDVKTRLASLHSDNEDLRTIMKRMADSLAVIEEKFTKQKREADSEIQDVKKDVAAVKADKKPTESTSATKGMPPQWMAALYVLAGVGLLALLQGAPQALLTMFPNLRSGF